MSFAEPPHCFIFLWFSFLFFFFINLNFIFWFGKKSVYCDYLLISDVIVEHEIKWTKTLISVVDFVLVQTV